MEDIQLHVQESKSVYVFCNKCRQNILLTIPGDDLEKRHGGLLNILSIHGEEKHAVVFYLDRQFRPRSTVHLDELPEIDKARIVQKPVIPLPSMDDDNLLGKLVNIFGDKRKKSIENFAKIAVQSYWYITRSRI